MTDPKFGHPEVLPRRSSARCSQGARCSKDPTKRRSLASTSERTRVNNGQFRPNCQQSATQARSMPLCVLSKRTQSSEASKVKLLVLLGWWRFVK